MFIFYNLKEYHYITSSISLNGCSIYYACHICKKQNIKLHTQCNSTFINKLKKNPDIDISLSIEDVLYEIKRSIIKYKIKEGRLINV